MDKDRNEMSKRILNFTLEIIYLLSGEEYIMVKKTSGDCTTPIIHESGGWSRSQSPITEPPPHSRIHKKNNKKKILELIYKMTELLTGEEWKYLEGHKDLYEEAMMENYRPRTSQDGSSRRNPPERCPSPLYSQDCPEENDNVPENLQGENLIDIKIEVKDEAEEETDIMAHQYGSSRRNPTERCPSPLYSQDCPEENPNVPEFHQGEDLTNINLEDKAEEEPVRGHQPCKSEVEEEIPGGLTTENSSKNSEGNSMLSINYKAEDEDIMQQSSGENLITITVHPGLISTDPSYNFPEAPSSDKSQIVTTSAGLKVVNRSQCGEQFTKSSGHFMHQRIHTAEKPYSCLECEKSFSRKSSLVRHKKCHTGDMPYSCSECGKCFTHKASLVIHVRIHTGEKPYSCSECGKCFRHKPNLVIHVRIHTGEKPYSCSECGKCVRHKANLVKHVRIHTGEKPYSCSECGKCFTDQTHLVTHGRIHTGEKPYTCSECGKCFTHKANLLRHERSHRGEKPYSCSECGKCFTQKTSLVKHERSHT
ncbi:uncharacterized protein LOC142663708 isoform X3 [Rhinoderma darwinii]|uniref:uncharacterized protein LOC142663708 isoform X3 n=1 Tax=Rhinoderma darwinii TaxID=43563 RepID=UPI003F67F8CC